MWIGSAVAGVLIIIAVAVGAAIGTRSQPSQGSSNANASTSSDSGADSTPSQATDPSPSLRQSASPSVSPTAAPKLYFTSTEKLYDAVDRYVQVGNDATSEVALAYGYPIEEWDTSRIQDFYQTFSGERNPALQTFNEPLGKWNLSSAMTTNRMFALTEFNQPIGNWEVGDVRDMGHMFWNSPFNQPIGDWDVSRVTNMRGMFALDQAFNQPIGNWQTGNVQIMYTMFADASSFNQPVGEWDTSQVTDMKWMFAGATAFNQPVSDWQVGKVTVMDAMFSGAFAFNQDVCDWGLRLNTQASVVDMFGSTGCPSGVATPTIPDGPFCYTCSAPVQPVEQPPSAEASSGTVLDGKPANCTEPFIWLSSSTCELTTGDEYVYKIINEELPPGQCIFFEAMARNDVHVGLFSNSTVTESPIPGGYYPDPTSVSFYEIVIGGWDDTQSTIRASGQDFDSE